ncbi:hypothetical protein [Arthrobacter sp. SO3]|uniref:hypothetical protein n=1 Tax=Arthrobacter sp. SO3 TaxID=1897057 RepID=UPI001CFF6448|nr:hypothetical protein [Arthrobacter sp. SO3]MCB5290694.1 hypothetical protein [Arthrobacter sp. SO3]
MRIPAGSTGVVLCAAAGAALSVVLLLTSCGLAPAPPAGAASESQSQGSAASPSATTPAGSPPSEGPSSEGPASGWETFTTANGELSFDYPAGWTVRDPGGALAGDFVDVLNAAGRPMAGLRTNIVTGAECLDKAPYRVYDSAPMFALAESGGGDGGVPRYVFESRGQDAGAVATQSTIAAYGITMVPEEAGDTACPMFHLFLWPPGGAFFGGTYNPENNVTPGDPALPYLEKARLYTSTPEYQDIRKMVTSLRPAGAPVGNAAGAPAGK